MAEPGEFTKRAFLNGRVDLTQAEAVMDLIRAKTDKAMAVAVSQLDGSLKDLINNTRQEILNTLAQVEVNIDYPEYDDVEEVTTNLVREKTQEFQALLEIFWLLPNEENSTRRSFNGNHWSSKCRKIESS